MGLADGIIDLVESGETMRASKLHSIHTLLETQATLITNKKPVDPARAQLIKMVVRRIQGVIDAERFVLGKFISLYQNLTLFCSSVQYSEVCS